MANNRDPGKDRERDKDINTSIDAEEADDIFTKDPWTTDDAVLDDDPSSHRPTRLGRKWITEAVRGVAGGMAGALNEELERRAPNLAVVKTELTDTWDDIKELREDLTKQLQPFTRSMENIARRILPRAKRAMPESWYRKMETSLQERADARAAGSSGGYSKEEEQSSTIRSELEAVFAQQQEHTLEVDHKKELDQKKERMIEQGLAATRHKADMRIYTRIYDAVRGTELFHRTLHTAYMKKSLEVQYKHFFVAQDTYNLLSQSFSAFEEYMRGVVKNTGLPDAAKANASDYLKGLRTQRYGMLMSEYLTNARKMIFGKIKNAASDALSGISMAATMAEMGPDMADAYMQEHGGAGGVGARVAGWILGRTKGSGLVRAGLDKIAPWVTALNGRTANFKDRLYLGIDKLQRQWSNDNNPFKQFIAQFLPNVSGVTGAPNDLLRDPEKPAVYDKATRQTIVEIIPGYLRHILHEVAMFRTGRDDLPMMTYNRYRRIFTSTDQFRKDMMNDQAMADSPETQAYRVNSFIQVIAKGAVSKNPGGPKDGGATAHAKTISKIMANHAVYNQPFDPDRLFEYVNNHKIDSYIEAIMSDIDPREFDATVRIILNGITNKDGTLNSMLANSVGDTITQMRLADQYKVTLPKNFEAFGDRDIISETAGEVYVDKKGIKRVFRNAQRGIVKDVTGEISKSFLSDRLADVDESKLTKAEDIAETYGYEELERHLNADEFVKNQVTAWKVSFEDSAPGKAMTWLAAKLGWFFDPNNDSKLPSLARILAGSAAVSLGKEKVSDTEKRIRKLSKASKIRNKEEASSSPAAIVNIVEATSKGTKPNVKGTRVTPKRRRSAKQQEPEAVDTVASEEIIEDTPISTGDTVVGGVALNVELPPTESKSSKINQWFSDNMKRLDESLDKIPQTPEDVEKQVASVVEFMDNAWKNRPKSAKEIQDKFENYIKHVSETHPELAKYAIDRANELANTRGYKFVAAWTKYLNDKIGKRVSKWIKDGYDKVAKRAAEAKSKLQSKASEIANSVIKASGSTMDAGIAFTAINPFAKKEDREAARQLIASEDPNLLKNLESHFKKEASDLYGTAREKFSSAMDATGGFIQDATKTAGNWWSKLKSKWREGTGVEESPERPAASGVSSSLMSLLEEWRSSQTRAHATLIEAAEHLIGVIEHRSFGDNETPNKDGRYVSIKEFNRDSYGFFGKGGSIIGNAVKKTASGVWWVGKTVAKASLHAALLPFQIPYYAVKGVAKVGGWAANSVGINPFRDIYVVGENKPVLTWRKQASKEGVYYAGTKTRPKSSKEIIEKGLPIVDHEGQYLITEEDIKKGLWAKDSSVAKGIGSVAGGIIKAPFSVAKAYINLETEVVKGIFGIGKTIAKGIFGSGAPEKYVDVYRKGEFKKPILSRRKQKEGVYLKDKDGNFSKLERSSDIHEPVYELINGEPQEIISEEDIEHGLCDVNGKPLGAGQYRGGLLGAALGLGAGLGRLGLKVLGGGTGMFFSFWKNAFGLMGRAGGMALKGLGRLGARLFGFDTKDGHGTVAVKSITDRLDVIIDLIKSGAVSKPAPAPAPVVVEKKEKPAKKAVHGSAAAISSIARLKGDKTKDGATIKGGAKEEESTLGKWITGGIGALGAWGVSKLPYVRTVKNAIFHPIRTYKGHKAAQVAEALLKEKGLPKLIIKENGIYRNPKTGRIVSPKVGEIAEKGGKVLFKDGGKLVDASGKIVKSSQLAELGVKDTSKLMKDVKAAEKSGVVQKIKAKLTGAKSPTPATGAKSAPAGEAPTGKFGKVVRGLGRAAVIAQAVLTPAHAAKLSEMLRKNADVILNKKRFCDVYRKGQIDKGPVLTADAQKKGLIIFKNWEAWINGAEAAIKAGDPSDNKVEPEFDLLRRSSDISSVICKTENVSGGGVRCVPVITEEDIKLGLVDVNGTPITKVQLSEVTSSEKGAIDASATSTAAAEIGTGLVDLVANSGIWVANKFGADLKSINTLDILTGATAAERAKAQAQLAKDIRREGFLDTTEFTEDYLRTHYADKVDLWGALHKQLNSEGVAGSWMNSNWNPLKWKAYAGAWLGDTIVDASNGIVNAPAWLIDTTTQLAQAPWVMHAAAQKLKKAEQARKASEQMLSGETMKHEEALTQLLANSGIKLPASYYHDKTVYDESGRWRDIHGQTHLGTSTARHVKGSVKLSEFYGDADAGKAGLLDQFEEAYKDKLPKDLDRNKWMSDKVYVDMFVEFLKTKGAVVDSKVKSDYLDPSKRKFIRWDFGLIYGRKSDHVYCVVDIPEEYDLSKFDTDVVKTLESEKFPPVPWKENTLIGEFVRLYLSGFDTPRFFYIVQKAETEGYGADGHRIIREFWEEWITRGPGVKYHFDWAKNRYEGAKWHRKAEDAVDEYLELFYPILRKKEKELDDAHKEEIKEFSSATSKESLESHIDQAIKADISEAGEEEWYTSARNKMLFPDATSKSFLNLRAKQYVESLPGFAKATKSEQDAAIESYITTYEAKRAEKVNAIKKAREDAEYKRKRAAGLIKEPEDPGYFSGMSDDDLELESLLSDTYSPSAQAELSKEIERRKAKKTPSVQVITQPAPPATSSTNPTVEAAQTLETQAKISKGITEMTNTQGRSIDLLSSIIGPGGLKVDGMPELIATTVAKPAGGNVTNVTNIMPTRTQEEGLSVRASQK